MQYMGEPTPATPASKYFAATVAMIAGAFFFAVGAGLLPIPGGPSCTGRFGCCCASGSLSSLPD